MDIPTIKLALTFLRRVRLTGAEVPEYQRVEQGLRRLLEEQRRQQQSVDRRDESS